MTKPTYHLHIVREREPAFKDVVNLHAQVYKAYCPGCGHDVHIIHIDTLPLVDPKREGVP